MKNNILVSIIIATYNSSETISKSINSILNQEYSNFEIIIIDNLSIDNTLNIIKKLTINCSQRICIVSEKDDGFYDAVNKGVLLAVGDLIGILGSDDYFNSKALSTVVSNYSSLIDIYYGNIFKVKNINNNLHYRIIKSDCLNSFQRKMPIRHPSVFVKRDFYNNFVFDTKFFICGDYHFLFKAFINKAKFFYINYEFVFMYEGGLSSNISKKLNEDFIIRKEFVNVYYAYYVLFLDKFKFIYFKLRRFIAKNILSKSKIEFYESKKWRKFIEN